MLSASTLVKIKEGLLRQRELEIDRYAQFSQKPTASTSGAVSSLFVNFSNLEEEEAACSIFVLSPVQRLNLTVTHLML